jgi:isomerase DpgB
MVTGEQLGQASMAEMTPDGRAGPAGLEIWIDGRRPLDAAVVAAVAAVCARSEEREHRNLVIAHVSGAPQEPPPQHLTVALVSKWELALRRLERLPAVTIAVADGDCGGLALDVLLATDHRIGSPGVRLLVPVAGGATWPGMALYRLARQAGESASRPAVLLGAPIEAGQALAMHLIDELTDDPASALAAAAEAAARVTGTELAIRRQLMMEAPTISFEDALGVHLAACDRALRHASAEAGR